MAPLYRLRRDLGRRLGAWREDAERRRRERRWRRRPVAVLVAELDLDDWGADALTIVDVDGDGVPELLFHQGQGIFQSTLYREGGKKPFLADGDGLSCLTVADMAGRVRWQHGRPYRGDRPYAAHAGEAMVAPFESRDGRRCVALLAPPDRLVVLDGSTGDLVRETVLPDDNFTIVDRLRTRQGDRLLVGVNDDGRPPHRYGQPTLILDTDLAVRATLEVVGSGHQRWIHAFDPANDGDEGAMVGYEHVDADGRRRWLLDAWHDREASYDAKRQHVDGIAPYAIDGRWYAAVAGSDRLYWIDDRGHVLWSATPRHAQYVAVGRFGPDDAVSVLLVDSLKDTAVQRFDLDGTARWRIPVASHWPMGMPDCVRGRWFHMTVPAVTWRGHGDHPDRLVVCESGWPYAVDGRGEVALTFPHTPRARKPRADLPAHRADDFGYAYQARAADLDGDGVEELVIHDRRHAWIYKPPEAA